ncbi:hypothetical protein [Desertivirga brevis]|uniref:hypothetical protein n=1 Tax=Desertivirga brevis TaxID=2810310 RepID=UPI001A95CCDE|nr:hypothetical protein [Pedobacter sp. SYSU D00873]
MKKRSSIIARLKSPTPPFFKKVRNVGLILSALGSALLSAPISLPVAITTVAGYLVTAGLVASAVSSTAVGKDEGQDLEGDGP